MSSLLTYGTSGYAREAMTYNGSAWSNVTGKYIPFSVGVHALGTGVVAAYRGGIFRFDDDLYLYHDNDVYKYSTSNSNWVSVGTAGSGEITSAIVMGSYVYFGKSSGDYYRMNTSDVISASGGGENAHLFYPWGQFLWRADGAALYYSGDGTTWTQVADFPDTYPIRGLAGMGEDIYAATDEGLFRVGAGDFVYSAMRWGSAYAKNGINMINHNGNLYIPVENRIYEFSASGTMRDIWPQFELLPTKRPGQILSLHTSNNWLMALTGNFGTSGLSPYYSVPMLWVWQGEGWHPLIQVGEEGELTGSGWQRRTLQTVYLDRTLLRLWFINMQGAVWWTTLSDYALNPYYDSLHDYMPFGWIEWDWFDGPIREIRKDYESVTVIGQNITSSTPVKVYWQDDSSTDWELLGTCDTDEEELRWTLASGVRPNTRRFKLALQLVSTDGDDTPRIDAVRVKYHPMLQDQFRYVVPIKVSGNSRAPQELFDLTVQTASNNDTGAEQLAHLNGLVKQVAPFSFTPPTGGSAREVKASPGCQFRLTRLEYVNGAVEYDGEYVMLLEEVTNSDA